MNQNSCNITAKFVIQCDIFKHLTAEIESLLTK